MRARPDRKTSWAVVLTLLALVFSLSVAGFVHTDDGCAVERHCAACVSALHHASGPSSAGVALPVSRQPVELQAPRVQGTVSTGNARIIASRGPPTA